MIRIIMQMLSPYRRMLGHVLFWLGAGMAAGASVVYWMLN
jgi:hypothetical protein